jgi:hypothetical protein
MLAIAVVGGVGAAAVNKLGSAAGLSAVVAVVSTAGKLAFDSLVQRDAPDANRGRSFARFEVRFQLVWVIGAMIPLLLLPIPVQVGYLVIAGTSGFALVSYLYGQRAAQRFHVRHARDDRPVVDVRPVADAPPEPTDIYDQALDPVETWEHGDPTWAHDLDQTIAEQDEAIRASRRRFSRRGR